MRTLIVGDIHGMILELRTLLQQVGFSKSDRLVLVGDLVDKGPDSAGVVRHLRELRESGHDVILVQGNHEEKHSRYRMAVAKTPGTPKMKGVEEMEAITAGLLPADIAFLDAALPFFQIPEHSALVVHGGILPTMTELDAQDKALRGRLLRVRHVRGRPEIKVTVEYLYDHEVGDQPDTTYMSRTVVKKVVKAAGEFVPLGDERPDDPFWADVYDGRFGHVFFGHSPFPTAVEPVSFPHATGLDLGAVYGGRLAAAILEPGRPTRFETVVATGKFATSFWEDE